MDLRELFGGSFVNWEMVEGSWTKRTVPSRLLLLAARRYLEETTATPEAAREDLMRRTSLPDEIRRAFAAPPEPDSPESGSWGEFIDAALATEMEMVSYGERPPLLHELRAGLIQAASDTGAGTPLGRWFTARHDALPGADLPDAPEYLPV